MNRSRALLALFLVLPLYAADTASLDAIASRFYKPDQPGASIIVVKDGKTLLRKGYGMADMELGVPIAPDMVFRIGSVTKHRGDDADVLRQRGAHHPAPRARL